MLSYTSLKYLAYFLRMRDNHYPPTWSGPRPASSPDNDECYVYDGQEYEYYLDDLLGPPPHHFREEVPSLLYRLKVLLYHALPAVELEHALEEGVQLREVPF